DWFTNPEGMTSEKQQKAAMRLREMSLPKELRATGKKRDLRDAYLGQMILSDIWMPRNIEDPMRHLALLAQRENARLQLKVIGEELAGRTKPEDVQWAKEAAKALFSRTLQQQRMADA